MKHRSLLIILLLAPALTLAQSAAAQNSRSPSSIVHRPSSIVAPAQNVTDPNDPLFPDQWALKHVGATCAWQTTTGSPDVTVAVVDSGVDLKHPDLVGRLRDDGHDYADNDDDPSDETGHGTNVAGIIAATLDNNEGGAGL